MYLLPVPLMYKVTLALIREPVCSGVDVMVMLHGSEFPKVPCKVNYYSNQPNETRYKLCLWEWLKGFQVAYDNSIKVKGLCGHGHFSVYMYVVTTLPFSW